MNEISNIASCAQECSISNALYNSAVFGGKGALGGAAMFVIYKYNLLADRSTTDREIKHLERYTIEAVTVCSTIGGIVGTNLSLFGSFLNCQYCTVSSATDYILSNLKEAFSYSVIKQ